ncbi:MULTISPECIES: AlpA family transcriptional regulator [unclassified Janthinobacterium]|uniref:AlpA family transcriptional regulator n=1 Tax=unclassified Janthinobacterium TaxID=2610881 RepID=UPI001829FA7E|nr:MULTISPECIES: AlpA family transcriptional regulator [unclassified Janthinobacterium]MBB5613122.1 prophage regulatory protein [Janthinobacterium sp. S3M3]
MSDMSEVKKFMRMPAVIEATGKARQTIYDNMKAGTFPQSVRIGPRSIAWDATEIAAWQKKGSDERSKSD